MRGAFDPAHAAEHYTFLNESADKIAEKRSEYGSVHLLLVFFLFFFVSVLLESLK